MFLGGLRSRDEIRGLAGRPDQYRQVSLIETRVVCTADFAARYIQAPVTHATNYKHQTRALLTLVLQTD